MTRTNPEVAIRSAIPADATAISEIYNHYIKTSVITFEEEPVSVSEMASRMREVQSQSYAWIVATAGADVLGYAYAGVFKTRAAYRYSSEVTVYVRAGQERVGIGSVLYGQLLRTMKEAGLHAAIGIVALPNEASVRLHEKFGFRKCGHFTEVGFKFNRWIDVGYWQLML